MIGNIQGEFQENMIAILFQIVLLLINRNDYYLYKREGIRGLLYLYPRLLVHIIRIIKSDKKDKKERINIIIRATRNGRKFNPKIEYID
jgi:hypothetical protein